jgi:hypothetical protein
MKPKTVKTIDKAVAWTEKINDSKYYNNIYIIAKYILYIYI